MKSRPLSIIAKTFSVLLAGGALINLLKLPAALGAGPEEGVATLLAVLLSVALSWLLWRAGSGSPPEAAPKPPADLLAEYQAGFRQATKWLLGIAALFAALLVLMAGVPPVGATLAPILPLVLLAAAIAFVRVCWFLVRARGRWR